MRLVIDTNLLISGLLSPQGLPAHVLTLWRAGVFDLLTSDGQLEEMRRVTRYPKIRERLPPALAGRLINEVRALAIMVDGLPVLSVCRDPQDDYLLALAQTGGADFLLSGDKRDVLALGRFGGHSDFDGARFSVGAAADAVI